MGFSTEGRLPVRRGYNHSLGFLGGGEDHYKQTAGACPGLGPTVDLWEDTAPVYAGLSVLTFATIPLPNPLLYLPILTPSIPCLSLTAYRSTTTPASTLQRLNADRSCPA